MEKTCRTSRELLDTNKINDSLMKNACLACIGRKTFTLLCSLTTPGDKEYDELVTLLMQHMAPKPLVILVPQA